MIFVSWQILNPDQAFALFLLSFDQNYLDKNIKIVLSLKNLRSSVLETSSKFIIKSILFKTNSAKYEAGIYKLKMICETPEEKKCNGHFDFS